MQGNRILPAVVTAGAAAAGTVVASPQPAAAHEDTISWQGVTVTWNSTHTSFRGCNFTDKGAVLSGRAVRKDLGYQFGFKGGFSANSGCSTYSFSNPDQEAIWVRLCVFPAGGSCDAWYNNGDITKV